MTMDESTPSVFGAGITPPGESLRQGRERAGFTQEDIAGKLKLAPRQIAAIETGDWGALPERTFTRGFMRNYARLVGIDPDSLGLDQSQTNAANQLKPTPEAIGEIAREKDRNGFSPARWFVPLLLISALAVGVLYFQGGRWFGWDSSKILAASAAKSKEASAVSAGAAPAVSAAVAGAATDAPAASSGAVIAPANAPIAAPPLDIKGVANIATTALIPVPPSLVAATLPPAPGDKRIAITFKGKSWTEVRSKGDVIFSETAAPGVREFTGSPPLSFTVGNAGNVTVSIDGKPFDMAELTRNDVARFRVE
ncbi:MAG: helix-turn-helix domain-containing protein [Rhizobacter sp.]|nr:helix-turn-helix domain-containing protein [Burkholderiales bacterium]